MKQYASTSLIYESAKSLSRYFKASNTYKVLCILLNWYRYSKVNYFIGRYLAKNSSIKHSVTFRICSRLFSFFDKLWDKLYSFGISCGKSSCFISFIRDSFCNAGSFQAYGLIVLFFSLGYGITSALLGTFGIITSILSGTGILISLLLFLGNAWWTACLKNSVFWRFVLYIFD